MNRLVNGAALVALTLLASLPALPASAAPVTLTVGDPDPLPGGVIPLSGDGDDCPADSAGVAGSFLATLTYTTVASTTATVTATGAVAADGTFTGSVTLPETAVSNVPASVISTSTCSGVATESNRVALAVLYHDGILTVSAPRVAAGGRVTTTGTNCFGGEFLVLYGPASGDPTNFDTGNSGVPGTDRKFSSILTIPADQAKGSYDIFVRCPGTQFPTMRLVITAAAASASPSASPAAPAVPVSPGPTTTLPAPDETFPVPELTSSEPVTTTTLGGGFTGVGATTSGGGGVNATVTNAGAGTNPAATPVATAPVAVRGEATFTG